MSGDTLKLVKLSKEVLKNNVDFHCCIKTIGLFKSNLLVLD